MISSRAHTPDPMFHLFRQMLEEVLHEVDRLIREGAMEDMEDRLIAVIEEWKTNGSILDGGRSIRIDGEVRNVYDMLALASAGAEGAPKNT